MSVPYYADDKVTLYLGDCREITEWLAADVLVVDPPYGRDWKQGELKRSASRKHAGIANDATTEVRDAILALWGDKPAVVFGDLMLDNPPGTKLIGAYLKPSDAGTRGAIGGHRRDPEALYWIGKWKSGIGGRSSLYVTQTPMAGGQHGPAGRYGHPHAKPLDVMEAVIAECPVGVIADPAAGSGSTLVAARNLGRKAIGVELDERYAETIARRLAQDCLDLDGAA
jgi:hypothetical protein